MLSRRSRSPTWQRCQYNKLLQDIHLRLLYVRLVAYFKALVKNFCVKPSWSHQTHDTPWFPSSVQWFRVNSPQLNLSVSLRGSSRRSLRFGSWASQWRWQIWSSIPLRSNSAETVRNPAWECMHFRGLVYWISCHDGIMIMRQPSSGNELQHRQNARRPAPNNAGSNKSGW